MLKLLQELCAIDGVSGSEDAVRDYIRAQAAPYADSLFEDVMGNLLVFKKGRHHSGRTILLAAHMDEVGLMIKEITEQGYLRFAPVGGINAEVLMGSRVRVGEKRVPGVIGAKAAHLSGEEERKKLPAVKDMTIDIGADSRGAAEALAEPGDWAAFAAEPCFYGGYFKAKAIDDRVGCAALLKLLAEGPAVDCWLAFTVQEELGLRGAAAAAWRIRPDIAITVEGTTAADLPGVRGALRTCETGRGPVVPVMDAASLYNPALVRLAFDTAARAGIPCQTKRVVAGGTDAGRISQSCGGAQVLGLAAPVRYIHTPASAVAVADLEPLYLLLREILASFGGAI